jgi:tetratricopeptide (TPR) repeat protein
VTGAARGDDRSELSKGRRAAERRREREQARGVDPHAQTRASVEATDPERDDVDPGAATAMHDTASRGRGELEFDEGLSDDTARLGDVAEVTSLRDHPPAPERHGGILEVREGEGVGTRIPLVTTPTLIGRASWVELPREDPTVSREHLELRFMQGDRSWIVQDLESSSGTLLNGAELSMPTQIKHGDLLAFGQTEMRFLWSANEPSEREVEPPKERTKTGIKLSDDRKTRTTVKPSKSKAPKRSGDKRSNLPLVAGIVVALLVVGGALSGAGYFVFVHGRQDDTQVKVQVQELVATAERLIDEGELREAKARLEAAIALSPEHPLVNSLLRTIDSDLDAYDALLEARKLFDGGKTQEALKALLRIPDSSRFAKDRKKLRTLAAERARKASVRGIEAKLEDGLLDEAEAALASHLSQWPDDPFAQGMQGRIQTLRDAPPPEDPTVARARNAFADGAVINARMAIEAEAARGAGPSVRYLADLDRFEAAAARGKAKLQRKDKGARADLQVAWELVPRLGRGYRGGVATSLKRPFADALFLDAVAKRGAGQQCEWAKAILRAGQLQPRDRKISTQRRQVEQKASAALTRARARKTDNPKQAAQIAREGLCFAAPRSPTAKALRKLSR